MQNKKQNGTFFRLVSWKKFGFSALGDQNKLALPTFELVELLMEVWDAFVLTLNEIMVSTTGFLPLLNAFRFRLSKDLRYQGSRSLLALAAMVIFNSRFKKFQAWSMQILSTMYYFYN